MKTILIISYTPLHRDPRIIRQAQALRDKYKILTIGQTPINDNNIIFYSCVPQPPECESEPRIIRTFWQKVLRRFTIKFWTEKIKKRLNSCYLFIQSGFNVSLILEKRLSIKYILSHNIENPDIIIANDWDGLYLASELKNKKKWHVKIYFDAHEYAPKEMNTIEFYLRTRPLVVYALKKCKDDIDIMSTVCDGIAREYERFFDFPDGFVKIVTNAAEYNDTFKPNPIVGGIIRLIHHGGAMRGRKLELMIDMMKYLDPAKYELTFMLVKGEQNYYDYLINLSGKFKNIKFIEPVKFSEITTILNNYDMGIYILKPSNYNNKHALPNKLFEFIQARLAIAIGPSIEMVKIIDHYNLGVHSKDFTSKSLAKAILQLTPEKIMEHKRNADKYAKELSAEENMNKIRERIAELEGE